MMLSRPILRRTSNLDLLKVVGLEKVKQNDSPQFGLFDGDIYP